RAPRLRGFGLRGSGPPALASARGPGNDETQPRGCITDGAWTARCGGWFTPFTQGSIRDEEPPMKSAPLPSVSYANRLAELARLVLPLALLAGMGLRADAWLGDEGGRPGCPPGLEKRQNGC